MGDILENSEDDGGIIYVFEEGGVGGAGAGELEVLDGGGKGATKDGEDGEEAIGIGAAIRDGEGEGASFAALRCYDGCYGKPRGSKVRYIPVACWGRDATVMIIATMMPKGMGKDERILRGLLPQIGVFKNQQDLRAPTWWILRLDHIL